MSKTAVGVPPRDCNLSSLLEDPRGDAHLAQEGTSMGMELLAPIALPTDPDAVLAAESSMPTRSIVAPHLGSSEPKPRGPVELSRVQGWVMLL